MGAQLNSARRVMDAIRHIVQALRVFDRAAEKQAGLSGAQLFVLQQLRDGRAVSLNEVARRTHTHQSSVSVVVQKLVSRGLLVRVKAAADGRRLELSITPAGRKVLASAPRAAQDRLIESLQGLPEKTRDELAMTLEGIVADMGKAGEIPLLFFEERSGAGKKKTRVRRGK